jgi:hypothetical protein
MAVEKPAAPFTLQWQVRTGKKGFGVVRLQRRLSGTTLGGGHGGGWWSISSSKASGIAGARKIGVTNAISEFW